VSSRPSTALVWFGVLGGPFAWATQFIANLWFSYAQCDTPGRWRLPVHGWQIGLSIVAVAVGLGSAAVSLRLYRRTAAIDGLSKQVIRGFGGVPPPGRIHFLAIVGLTVNFLSLLIIVMTGIGAPLLDLCQQS
jgi:hypothetical protein